MFTTNSWSSLPDHMELSTATAGATGEDRGLMSGAVSVTLPPGVVIKMTQINI